MGINYFEDTKFLEEMKDKFKEEWEMLKFLIFIEKVSNFCYSINSR